MVKNKKRASASQRSKARVVASEFGRAEGLRKRMVQGERVWEILVTLWEQTPPKLRGQLSSAHLIMPVSVWLRIRTGPSRSGWSLCPNA